jgi:hypothetical protein
MVLLVGCLDKSSDSSGSTTGSSTNQPKAPASSIDSAVTRPSSGLVFRDLDGGPVDGSENIIMACTSDGSYCFSTCISSYFPQFVRYSLFRTDFLLGNKCAASLLAYPDDSGLPAPFYYWQGQYVATPGRVVGTCSVNLSNPTFMGRSTFEEVRVPEGQPTSGPRIYYTHNWYNVDGTPYRTLTLQNYLPPGYYVFKDSSFTTSDITMALVSGFSCIKLEEVGNAFQ